MHQTNLFFEKNRHLWCLGHRGVAALFPENTLTSFKQAYQLGFHGIECDVMLSKEGVPFVFHDHLLEQRFLPFRGKPTQFSFDALQQIDLDLFFKTGNVHRIPSFEEVLAWFSTTNNFLLNVELKQNRLNNQKLISSVAAILEANQVNDRVLVSSFNPLLLRQWKKQCPSVPTALNIERSVPKQFYSLLMKLAKTQIIHPHFESISPALLQWAVKHQYQINTWTVNDPETAQHLLDLGIAHIITDTPTLLEQK